jgi:hypothetical protein
VLHTALANNPPRQFLPYLEPARHGQLPTLLRTDNSTPVPVSIDPFFVHHTP